MRFAKSWLPVVFWMGVIFFGSTDAMSGSHTSRFVVPLIRWFLPAASTETVETIHLIIRKGWHLTEYAILALWVSRALTLRTPPPAGACPWRVFRIALVICALYACSDEFHQSFVPSRGASVDDVALDTFGSAVGLALRWAFGRWRGVW
jgi:VanZ family protein